MLRLFSTFALTLVLAFTAACDREASPSTKAGARKDERQPFTILATGDNKGRIAPCGCAPPVGGLPRRVAAIEKYREEGPVLVLDAGDALTDDGRVRLEEAQLILKGMAATGIAAAAVGEDDLAMGVDWLVEEAAKAGVPYLSSNLRNEAGEAPFPGRKIVEVGGNRVGIFSVLGFDRRLPADYSVVDATEAAQEETKALRDEGAEFVIGLVHAAMRDANRIAEAAGADLIIPGHRGGNTNPYLRRDVWVAHAGWEGRSLLELKLDLRGEGKLADLSLAENLAVQAEELKRKIAYGKRQIEQMYASPQKTEVEELVDGFKRELARIEKEREGYMAAGRTMRSRFLTLDGDLGEDETFLAELDNFEEFAR